MSAKDSKQATDNVMTRLVIGIAENEARRVGWAVDLAEQLQIENTELRKENHALKSRLCRYETGLALLKSPGKEEM